MHFPCGGLDLLGSEADASYIALAEVESGNAAFMTATPGGGTITNDAPWKEDSRGRLREQRPFRMRTNDPGNAHVAHGRRRILAIVDCPGNKKFRPLASARDVPNYHRLAQSGCRPESALPGRLHLANGHSEHRVVIITQEALIALGSAVPTPRARVL
jgi:hypothetical protein